MCFAKYLVIRMLQNRLALLLMKDVEGGGDWILSRVCQSHKRSTCQFARMQADFSPGHKLVIIWFLNHSISCTHTYTHTHAHTHTHTHTICSSISWFINDRRAQGCLPKFPRGGHCAKAQTYSFLYAWCNYSHATLSNWTQPSFKLMQTSFAT